MTERRPMQALLLSSHRNKTDRQHCGSLQLARFLAQQIKMLVSWSADRNDHPPAFLELFHQRGRHMVGRTGYDNRVERGGFRPAFVTVAGFCDDIGVTEPI